MEIILLLFVLEYILCFRKEYYTKCAYDSEYIINPSTKKCNYYNPSDGYCCYLTYQEYSDEPFDGGGEITKGDNEDKIKNDSKKLRKLLDIDSDCCIGISRIGYNHIDKVIKVSDEIYMEIPLSYEDETDRVVKILNKAVENIRKHENVIEADYIGIDKFADSSINYKLKILCKPENKFAVRRFVNGTIKKELDKNGISIPYPQLTIHKGE